MARLMTGLELDPRWDWHEVTQLGDRAPRYLRGRCRHLEAVPVEAVTGETVAQLCLTCDTQLPPARIGTVHAE